MSKKQNVPIFILAGGLGTRLSEETTLKPKPMVEVGEIPVLLHIMRWYYSFGFDDFVICAGYRAWEIKQYFLTYEFRHNHLMIDHRKSVQSPAAINSAGQVGHEKWRVRVIDTGLETMTGARLARAYDAVSSDGFEQFGITYGDGLCDVDLDKEFDFHMSHGEIGTVLGAHPVARFGDLQVDDQNRVIAFKEKHQSKQDFINAGFFFFKKEFRKYLSDSADCVLELKPLAKLADDRKLRIFKYDGFWHPMDTLRDRTYLQGLWDSGKAPWAVKTK